MKKRFSTLTVVIIAFLMLATGVAANEGYRKWAGTDDFRQTEKNLANIQTGITTLQGNLETVENELTTTKTQLEDAEADSNTKQEKINELNDKVTALESEKELIKSELAVEIREANGEKGPRHKYDAVKEIVNKLADKLGVAATSRLEEDHGTSTEYDEKVKELNAKKQELEAKEQELEAKQEQLNAKESELTESNSDLQQAEKDMESLKNQSGEVLESLNTSTEKEPTDTGE